MMSIYISNHITIKQKTTVKRENTENYKASCYVYLFKYCTKTYYYR